MRHSCLGDKATVAVTPPTGSEALAEEATSDRIWPMRIEELRMEILYVLSKC